WLAINLDLNRYSALGDSIRGGSRREEEKKIKLRPLRALLKLRLRRGSEAGLYRISVVDPYGNRLTGASARSRNGKSLNAVLDLRRAAPMAHRLRVERRDDMNEYLIEIAKPSKRMTQSPWISRRVKWMTCWLIFIPLIFTPSPRAKAAQDATRLELGRPLERMIGGGEIQRYRIALSPGLYLRVAVTQQGIDVIVTVLDPAGRKIAQVDRPYGAYGPEDVSVIAEEAGDYTIELKTALKFAAPGRYLITATETREAKAEDRRRIAAECAVSEAEELRGVDTADSLSQAVEKFSQAITIWRSLGERYEEAVAVYGRGWSYRSLGDYYNAICDLRQAALRMESLQERNAEAVARSALAWLYLYVGENEQARENFGKA